MGGHDSIVDDVFSVAAPDGGYGWVVVLASFLLQFLSIGTTFTFGVLYVDLLVSFGNSRANTAWVGSLQPFTLYLTGIIAGPIIKRVGCRPVAMVGAVISAIGMTTSAAANSVVVLYFTYGVLTGIGNGLMYIAAVLGVQYYFDERRSIATGLAVAGSGAGMLVYGVLTRFLLEHLEWQITLLIEGAIMLTGVICGGLIRPIESKSKDVSKTEISNSVSKENSGTASQSSEQKSCGIIHVVRLICIDTFDLSMFKRPRFCLFSIAMVLWCYGYHAPFTYLPDRAMHLGIDRSRASFLVSVVGIANLVSRLGLGFLSDYSPGSRFYMGGFALTLGGVASTLFPFVTSYVAMVIYAIWFGVMTGTFASLFPVLLVDLLGVNLMERAIGLTLAISSIAFLTSSPICGWIIDLTNSFNTPFYLVGGLQILGGVFYFCIRFIYRGPDVIEKGQYEPIAGSSSAACPVPQCEDSNRSRSRTTSPPSISL